VERTLNWQLRNGALKGELLSRAEMERAGAQFMGAVRARIECSSMPKTERQALLLDLASWPVTIKAVVERQLKRIRLRPEQDGDGDGEEAVEERDSPGSHHTGHAVKTRQKRS
jgi:hypothetical protein